MDRIGKQQPDISALQTAETQKAGNQSGSSINQAFAEASHAYQTILKSFMTSTGSSISELKNLIKERDQESDISPSMSGIENQQGAKDQLMQQTEQMMQRAADIMSSLGFSPPSSPQTPMPSKSTIKGAKDFAQKHPDEADKIKKEYAQVQDDKKALNQAIITYGPHSPQAMNASIQLQTDKMMLMTYVMSALNIHTTDQMRAMKPGSLLLM